MSKASQRRVNARNHNGGQIPTHREVRATRPSKAWSQCRRRPPAKRPSGSAHDRRKASALAKSRRQRWLDVSRFEAWISSLTYEDPSEWGLA